MRLNDGSWNRQQRDLRVIQPFISAQSVLSENLRVSHDTSRLAKNKKTGEKNGDCGTQTK